mgnify:CR=1 FL=1
MTKSTAKPVLPSTPTAKSAVATSLGKKVRPRRNRKSPRKKDSSDVLISAVVSTYLLTHLHNVLQRAEYGATKEGRTLQAENFAQLRKVLCMDARSMEDASARGLLDEDLEKFNHSKIVQKAA